MAHHYAGGPPVEAVNNLEIPVDEGVENIRLPGSDASYELDFDLDLGQLVHDGDLVQPEVAKGLSVFEEFMQNYKDSETGLEVFLGYADNDWTAEDMWHATDMSRDSIYSVTEALEEDYGLVETDFGDVELTRDGESMYETFLHISEQA